MKQPAINKPLSETTSQRFLVMINGKYLVSVDALSNGGAEHRVLDAIPYEGVIQSCQAFSKDDAKTDFFRDNAFGCKTISIEELTTMIDTYAKYLEKIARLKDKIDEAEDDILKLESQIEQKRADISSMCTDMNEAIKFKNNIF